MRGAARVTDRTIGDCSEHGKNIGGTIITGAVDVTANGLPRVRVTDTVLCDCGCQALVITGSPDVLTNGLASARISDLVKGPTYFGSIVTASGDVVIN